MCMNKRLWNERVGYNFADVFSGFEDCIAFFISPEEILEHIYTFDKMKFKKKKISGPHVTCNYNVDVL